MSYFLVDGVVGVDWVVGVVGMDGLVGVVGMVGVVRLVKLDGVVGGDFGLIGKIPKNKHESFVNRLTYGSKPVKIKCN